MKNVLLCYRLKRFDQEIAPLLETHIDDNVTIILQTEFEKKSFKNMRKFKNSEYSNMEIQVYSTNDLLNGVLNNMKGQFDYIVGNPPYQEIVGHNTGVKKKTQQLWAKLIVKFWDILKDDGEMTLVHPSGWRLITPNSMQAVLDVNQIYTNNEILSMEFHDLNTGVKTFGARTEFDKITVKKTAFAGDVEIITRSDGKITRNLKNYAVIPTDNFEWFDRLLAKDGQEKVELLHSYTIYESRKKYISETQDDNFKYPVIYSMPLDKINYIYSSENQHGHFGIPKVIIARVGATALVDENGLFGLSQFAVGIVDTIENLHRIKCVLETPEFKKLKDDFLGITGLNTSAIIDNKGNMFKFIKEFRKDFWKEFYTEEMQQELIDTGVLDDNGNYI